MFDGIINNLKGSLDMVIMFFVAGLVGMVIGTLVNGGTFDAMAILMFAISAAVAGLATSMIMGIVKG
ncbi:MAG: hypothetical protein ACTSU8_01245 [Alphaproteobacteria bacterium]